MARSWRTLAWLLAAWLFSIATPSFAGAQEPSADEIATSSESTPAAEEEEFPPPLTKYKGRVIAPTMGYAHASWLTRPERQKEEDCEQLLKVLDFPAGAVVCDMGCGNGFYTLPFAEKVGPTGMVYAVDIQPEMLELLKDRLKEKDLSNVAPVLGTVIDPKLPEGELDAIVLIDVYHEFSHPVHMLEKMRAALKPKGRLILVEFRLEDPTVPIRLEHKMSKKQVLKELRPNGFKLVDQYDNLPWQHVMAFEPTPVKKKQKSKDEPSKQENSAADETEEALSADEDVNDDRDQTEKGESDSANEDAGN